VLIAADSVADRVVRVAHEIAECSGLMPYERDRAVESVETCIGSFGNTMWPAVAWRFSSLSVDGSPLQFDFSTKDNRLRYVTEVAPPEVEAHDRLSAAAALIEQLGNPSLPTGRLSAWKALQSERALRWGAWLGIRHDGATARAKLYVEVPQELREPASTGLVRPIVPSSRLMMIGFHCGNHGEEYYFRQPQMASSELSAFLRFIGDAPHREGLLDAFAKLCALPARAALDWVNFGYSITTPSETRPDFSIFARARSLRASPRIRRQFLRAEAHSGRAASAYRDLVGELPDERLPDHEIVSLIARGGSNIELRVGISAVAMARL
jgi:hypothetical protein